MSFTFKIIIFIFYVIILSSLFFSDLPSKCIIRNMLENYYYLFFYSFHIFYLFDLCAGDFFDFYSNIILTISKFCNF